MSSLLHRPDRDACSDRDAVVTEDMVKELPAPMQRHLRYTGVVGKPLVDTVHLKQKGKMRRVAQGSWMPLDAEEYYTVQPPGFVWDGTLRLGPIPIGRARDMYRDGKGNMLIKLAAIYTIADTVGTEIDQGSLMRYFSEMIWFPTAFLGESVSCTPIDDHAVRATFSDHGRSVSATLCFDDEGQLTDFVAERYRMVGGRYELTPWSTPITEYGEFEGLKLPAKGKAVWKLPEGDLEYIEVPPESFLVKGKEGPLVEGELARARTWAHEVRVAAEMPEREPAVAAAAEGRPYAHRH